MQQEAPEAFDLSSETDATLDLYGLTRGQTTGFGWQCLVARRLAERGVRFVELIDTGSVEQLGLARQHAGPRRPGQERRSADRRPAHRPQTARPAGRHAGRLDHRVRPHALPRAGRATPAASTITRRSRPGWPAAASRAGSSTARPTTTASPWPRTGSTSTTSTPRSCTCSASTTSGSPYRHAGRDYRLTDVSGEVVKEILA